MSVQAITAAIAIRGVTASEKLLLMMLANYADEHMRCYPSQRRLAEETALSDRTVRALLAGLEGRGLLSREERTRSDNSRSSDLITLHLTGAEMASGGAEATSGGRETVSGGVRKPLPGGAEMVSGLTTFEPSTNHSVSEETDSAAHKSKAKKPNKGAFNRFWAEYPLKVGKLAAERSYAKAWGQCETDDPEAEMLAGLRRCKPLWDEPDFIPHPTTWLNQGRWLDQPIAEMPEGTGPPRLDLAKFDEERARLAAQYEEENAA